MQYDRKACYLLLLVVFTTFWQRKRWLTFRLSSSERILVSAIVIVIILADTMKTGCNNRIGYCVKVLRFVLITIIHRNVSSKMKNKREYEFQYSIRCYFSHSKSIIITMLLLLILWLKNVSLYARTFFFCSIKIIHENRNVGITVHLRVEKCIVYVTASLVNSRQPG